MAATAALVGLQLIGASAEADALKQQGEHAQFTADMNARLFEMEAADALKRGEENVENYKKQARQLQGSQKVALAAQGIEIDSGSALDIQSDTEAQIAEDIATIKNNAWRQSFGYEQEAVSERMAGQYANLASRNKANTTLLAGGINAASTAFAGFGGKGKAKGEQPKVQLGGESIASAGAGGYGRSAQRFI